MLVEDDRLELIRMVIVLEVVLFVNHSRRVPMSAPGVSRTKESAVTSVPGQ